MRAVLIPIRSFAGAKMRLAGVLDEPARAELVRDLAARVIAAASPLPVAVVCEDVEVERFAAEHGADVLVVQDGLGLSGSVEAGVARLAAMGVDVVTVAHGDLALVTDLLSVGHEGSDGGPEVTIAPDRRLDGTNVISVPADSGFCFAYGPGSFARHRAEAGRLGLACRVVYDWNLAVDIDLPEDLELLGERARVER